MRMIPRRLSSALCSLMLINAAAASESAGPTKLPDEAALKAMTARFAPVTLTADTSALPANEKLALAKLVEAAKIIDALFIRQSAPLNETYLAELVRDTTPLGRARLHYFSVNAGPWSRLDSHVPFLPGVGAKPAGGNFYPIDTTRDELDAWIASLDADA